MAYKMVQSDHSLNSSSTMHCLGVGEQQVAELVVVRTVNLAGLPLVIGRRLYDHYDWLTDLVKRSTAGCNSCSSCCSARYPTVQWAVRAAKSLIASLLTKLKL